MIRAAICDDECSMSGQLERLLKQGALEAQVNLSTEVFDSGRALVDSVRKGNYSQVILMDGTRLPVSESRGRRNLDKLIKL